MNIQHLSLSYFQPFHLSTLLFFLLYVLCSHTIYLTIFSINIFTKFLCQSFLHTLIFNILNASVELVSLRQKIIAPN